MILIAASRDSAQSKIGTPLAVDGKSNAARAPCRPASWPRCGGFSAGGHRLIDSPRARLEAHGKHILGGNILLIRKCDERNRELFHQSFAPPEALAWESPGAESCPRSAAAGLIDRRPPPASTPRQPQVKYPQVLLRKRFNGRWFSPRCQNLRTMRAGRALRWLNCLWWFPSLPSWRRYCCRRCPAPADGRMGFPASATPGN